MITIKYLAAICCLATFVIADKYTNKYDNINIQEILDNRRLLLAYIECIMDRGKCTPEGKELREHIEDALQTGCSKCTEPQEKGATQVIEHLIKNEPKIWKELVAKYDPEGKYRKKYEDTARQKGIVIPE